MSKFYRIDYYNKALKMESLVRFIERLKRLKMTTFLVAIGGVDDHLNLKK